MENIILQVKKRDLSVKPKYLRVQFLVPGICYGMNKEEIPLEVPYQACRKMYENAGTNTIIKLEGEGIPEDLNVLIQDLEYHPVTNKIEHIDFLRVDMNKPVYATVPLTFIGVSPAVLELGGTLTHHKHEIEIKCLPKYLIHDLQVDVSPIIDFHTSIHIKDLIVGEGVEIIDSPDDVVATAVRQTVEEVAPKEEVAVEGAEVVKEEGKEGKENKKEEGDKKSEK